MTLRRFCTPLVALLLPLAVSTLPARGEDAPAAGSVPSAVSADALKAVEAARKEADAQPTDPALRQKLVEALLAASEFPQAYEQAQKLMELKPGDADVLRLLGDSCFGLGLFDEAFACYMASLQLKPGFDDRLGKAAYVLAARTDGAAALEALKAAGKIDDQLYEGLLDSLPAPRGSNLGATVADPAEPAAAPAQSVTRTAVINDPAKIVTAKLSDNFHISAKLDGQAATFLFSTTASGLIISDDLAHRLNIKPVASSLDGGSMAIKGMGQVKTLELGGVSLSGVTVLVSGNVNQSNQVVKFDGILGPDLFPGYSYRLDRRKERLELFPPTVELPPAVEGAAKQPFYLLDGFMLSDVVVKNRDSDQVSKVKMIIDTGLPLTLYNLQYATAFHFGVVDSTTTVTQQYVGGHEKTVAVRRSAVNLAGADFEFDQYWAIPMPAVGQFIPFGYLGQDILREFRVTVDTTRRTMTFECYTDKKGKLQKLPATVSPGPRK